MRGQSNSSERQVHLCDWTVPHRNTKCSRFLLKAALHLLPSPSSLPFLFPQAWQASKPNSWADAIAERMPGGNISLWFLGKKTQLLTWAIRLWVPITWRGFCSLGWFGTQPADCSFLLTSWKSGTAQDSLDQLDFSFCLVNWVFSIWGRSVPNFWTYKSFNASRSQFNIVSSSTHVISAPCSNLDNYLSL